MSNSLFKRRFSGILLIICLILILNLFEKDIRNFFYFISASWQEFFFEAGKKTTNFFAIFIKTSQIQKQNQAILQENQFLKSKIANLQELKKENENLRQALGLELQKEFQLLFAQITLRQPSQDFILINKGNEYGIMSGQPVITAQKTLIGKVAEVYTGFSRIKLISEQNFSFPGKIQEKELGGIIKGKGQGELVFDLIPQNEQIEPGQTIVTVNLDNLFPGGILVGEIETIEKSDLEPFQKAKIRPAFDLKTLDFIFIIL